MTQGTLERVILSRSLALRSARHGRAGQRSQRQTSAKRPLFLLRTLGLFLLLLQGLLPLQIELLLVQLLLLPAELLLVNLLLLLLLLLGAGGLVVRWTAATMLLWRLLLRRMTLAVRRRALTAASTDGSHDLRTQQYGVQPIENDLMTSPGTVFRTFD